jgi:hypothetical protein
VINEVDGTNVLENKSSLMGTVWLLHGIVTMNNRNWMKDIFLSNNNADIL